MAKEDQINKENIKEIFQSFMADDKMDEFHGK